MERKRHYKVIVIGAGPAGMACAYQLAQLGTHDVLLVEASDTVGGLSRSIDFMGAQVDIGPHRFLTQHASVFQFYKEVLGKDLLTIERKTRIHFRDQFIQYPLAMGNIVKVLGIGTGSRILSSYIAGRFKTYGDHFEGALKARFGDYLFDLFFKDYSEKLWGLPVSEIDASWAEQRIQGFSLTKAVANLFVKGKENTNSDFFYYPRFGAGSFYQRLQEQLNTQGVTFALGKCVKNIRSLESSCHIEVTDHKGESYTAEHVVSTMPLNHLVQALPTPDPELQDRVNKLQFRSTVFVYVQLDKADLFEDQWTYLQMPEVLPGRMTNFNNWSPDQLADASKTHLCLEYWTNEGDALFMTDEDTFKTMAQNDLERLGILKDAKVVASKVLKVAKTYPVYYKGYQEDVDFIERRLQPMENLYPIGRYGSYKYNNQDHSLLMGMQAAHKIMGATVDLWRIDHNSYIEKGNIDETVS